MSRSPASRKSFGARSRSSAHDGQGEEKEEAGRAACTGPRPAGRRALARGAAKVRRGSNRTEAASRHAGRSRARGIRARSTRWRGEGRLGRAKRSGRCASAPGRPCDRSGRRARNPRRRRCGDAAHAAAARCGGDGRRVWRHRHEPALHAQDVLRLSGNDAESRVGARHLLANFLGARRGRVLQVHHLYHARRSRWRRRHPRTPRAGIAARARA